MPHILFITFGVIIYAMKAMLGKRFPYFLALLILEIIVIFITVIWTFKDSGFFKSVYDFISKSHVAFNILGFIADWAEVISGVVALIALVVLFISFKKFRRGRAINRLHNWARNGVVVLAQYRQENTDESDSPAEGYEEVEVLLDKVMATSGIALNDARYLGGEIKSRTRATVEVLRAVKTKLAAGDDSLFEDLQSLKHDFADVMILVFELIK